MAADYIINADLKRIFEEVDLNTEKLEGLINEIKRWPIKLDTATIGFVASSWITSMMERLNQQPEDITLFERIETILKLLRILSIDLGLWEAQNAYFSLDKRLYAAMKERSEREDPLAQSWIESFSRLGHHLHVKIPR
jgi:hypothetical protein